MPGNATPSRRTPLPSAARYVVITPVSGKALGRVLRRDAALDGKAVRADLVLRETQVIEAVPCSDAHLRLHNINTCHLLRDGVLHLHGGSLQ